MISNNTTIHKVIKLNQMKSEDKFVNLKNNFCLQMIFNIINKKILLEIVKYNKYIQQRINININNYKEYSELYSSIEIELIPTKNKYGYFINIGKFEEIYFHIYFNYSKEEIKRTYFIEDDNVKKINIKIDYQVTSFLNLFSSCNTIESINFKKFYRNNIDNMIGMFSYCRTLTEINFSNFNTNNVTHMVNMFYGCSSLKELNLSNFDTKNVRNMKNMFSGCSEELKKKIRSQYKNIKEEAFN